MRIGILTNEYPPHVYGGAGVHVEYLTRELAAIEDVTVDVMCFGNQRIETPSLHVEGVLPPFASTPTDGRHAKVLDTLAQDLVMGGRLPPVDLVHCHTWY